ncbi:uncharacterized protein LOC104430754 [Eucalyptus grandis]|uniref:uncharacterized protein LOC104430754 n=1 Tax=Eucalyptus grandis TaxID=71139 RepID=UPI00192EAFB6|nr:uncharacterized protein LOC104430754 [Eucalyptus grandis]
MPKAKEFKLQLRLLVPKFLKTMGHAVTPRSHIWYGERELSFKKTPVVQVKMYRSGLMQFMFPCINPKVDFDMELDDEEGNRVHNGYDSKKKSFCLKKGDKEELLGKYGFELSRTMKTDI